MIASNSTDSEFQMTGVYHKRLLIMGCYYHKHGFAVSIHTHTMSYILTLMCRCQACLLLLAFDSLQCHRGIMKSFSQGGPTGHAFQTAWFDDRNSSSSIQIFSTCCWRFKSGNFGGHFCQNAIAIVMLWQWIYFAIPSRAAKWHLKPPVLLLLIQCFSRSVIVQ